MDPVICTQSHRKETKDEKEKFVPFAVWFNGRLAADRNGSKTHPQYLPSIGIFGASMSCVRRFRAHSFRRTFVTGDSEPVRGYPGIQEGANALGAATRGCCWKDLSSSIVKGIYHWRR